MFCSICKSLTAIRLKSSPVDLTHYIQALIRHTGPGLIPLRLPPHQGHLLILTYDFNPPLAQIPLPSSIAFGAEESVRLLLTKKLDRCQRTPGFNEVPFDYVLGIVHP